MHFVRRHAIIIGVALAATAGAAVYHALRRKMDKSKPEKDDHVSKVSLTLLTLRSVTTRPQFSILRVGLSITSKVNNDSLRFTS